MQSFVRLLVDHRQNYLAVHHRTGNALYSSNAQSLASELASHREPAADCARSQTAPDNLCSASWPVCGTHADETLIGPDHQEALPTADSARRQRHE